MEYIIETVNDKEVLLEIYTDFIELIFDKQFDYDFTEKVYNVLDNPEKVFIEITVYISGGESIFNKNIIVTNQNVHETLEVLLVALENLSEFEACKVVKQYLDSNYNTITN